MNTTGRTAVAFLTVIPLTACVTTNLAPGAATVTLTNQAQDVQGCKAAGNVRAPWPGANEFVDSPDPETVMRNQAVGLGADTVFLTDGTDGVAYQCGAPGAARVAGSPATAAIPAPTPMPPMPSANASLARAQGPRPPVTVRTATAVSGDMPVRLPALGAVVPLQTVSVKPQISGQLTQLAITEGQLVHAGDLVAVLDERSARAAADLAQADLKRDQALLASVRSDAQKRALAQSVVDADQAAVTVAQLNLERTHILAPVSGRAGLRLVDPGNYVTPTDANGIVVITQLAPISVVFTLPEDDARQITQRLTAGAVLPVTLRDRSNTQQLAEGRLLTIDNQIDSTTGTVKLRAVFDNKDGALFPNQFVNVQLLVDTLHGEVLIPGSAVHRGAPNGVSGTFVYVLDARKRTVSVRAVTVGVADGETVAITAGLKPGDVVVTEGGDRLHDGSPVQLARQAVGSGAGSGASLAAGSGDAGTGR